jgi:DNA-binding beta-propeller fold protein YncE
VIVRVRPILLLLAVAALAAPAGAEMMTFTLKPVLFLESHLYEGSLHGPESVFVDAKRGEVWVADTRNNLIGVFSLDGMPLYAFGSKKHLREPRQVAVDPAGRVLVLDNDRGRIHAFNYRGIHLGDLVPERLPEKGQIAAFAFGPDGSLWIGEASNGEILLYDYPSMRLRRRFGSRGDEEGQFQAIASLAVNERYVVVLDHTGLAVQVFNHRGDFIKGWGQHAMGGANFSLPRSVAIDAKDRIVVTDSLRHDLKYFDVEGRFIGHFGGAGRKPGSVSFPCGVAVAPDGRVYVAERGNARVQVFEEQALEKPVPVP